MTWRGHGVEQFQKIARIVIAKLLGTKKVTSRSDSGVLDGAWFKVYGVK